MLYHETLSYLYGLQTHGIKLGLDTITALLAALGNPHRAFPSVHVAGTNGKGSVSAMIASILQAAGYKVGLFTSPHLISFTERISVNGRPVTENEVIDLAEEVRQTAAAVTLPRADAARPLSPTFFEVVTAMAMLHYARNGTDWGVIEVGMGGRLDATNIVDSRVSVITKIHVDHQQFLGRTIRHIAREKAGIMKPGIPVVSPPQEKAAREILEESAAELGCPLLVFGRDFSGRLTSADLSGVTFDFESGDVRCRDLFVPLPGDHQFVNACVAAQASITTLSGRVSPAASLQEVLQKGLAAAKWPGRIEVVEKDPLVILDGAHNPDAARALSEFATARLRDYRLILVIGMMSDKDIKGVLRYLMPISAEIVTCAPHSGTAASPETIAELARDAGFESIHIGGSVEEALVKAKEIARRRHEHARQDGPLPAILVTGSLYIVGEVKTLYGERSILGGLREHR